MEKLPLTPNFDILAFGVHCAAAVDACWFESERTGRATVHMPPERMRDLYNLPIRDGLAGLEEAIRAKFQRKSRREGHFIVNHARIMQVCGCLPG